MPGKGARGGADVRRAAAVLLLVAVAAIGLRAGGAFSAAGSPQILGLSGRVVYWIIASAEVVLALAGIALLIARVIWARRAGVARRQRRSMWWLLLLPFAALGLARILQKLRRHAAPAAAARHLGAPAGAGGGHLAPGSPWPLLALFAAAALAAGALTAYRSRRGRPLPPLDPGAEPDAAPLAAALAAGARALHSDPDPRAAIIACYAAMELSLADAGLPPRLADTPAEVLSRATAGGLVRAAGAATLTGLFRQARYSSHEMTEADRAAAVEALAQVRADLGSELAPADRGGGR